MRYLHLLAFAFFAVACGGSNDAGTGDDAATGGGPDLATVADLTVTPDLARGILPNGYPGPPYGTGAGDVIDNFTFKGYLSPSATTGLASDAPRAFGDVTLNDIRKSQGNKILLFWFAGFT